MLVQRLFVKFTIVGRYVCLTCSCDFEDLGGGLSTLL